MTKQLNSLILLIFMSFSMLGHAQSKDQRPFDQFLDLLGQQDRFMGTIVIRDKRKEVYAHAVGHTDLDQGIKADIHTVPYRFHLQDPYRNPDLESSGGGQIGTVPSLGHLFSHYTPCRPDHLGPTVGPP